jgi:hypothetical protein
MHQSSTNTTFVGYHGTSSHDVPSILAAINPPSGRNYGGWSQLGPGFYVTPDRRAAKIFAQHAALQRGGSATILAVYADDFAQMISYEVPMSQWVDAVPDALIADYDYLTAPISGMEWAMQHKFNPRAYARLQARPDAPPDP